MGLIGYKHTAEAKRKIGEANRRRTVSTETRQRMSVSKRGRKHTAETRAKMSKIQRGKPQSEEHKRKRAEALKGRTFTPEHRANLRAASKRRWDKKKAEPDIKTQAERLKSLGFSMHQIANHFERTVDEMFDILY